MHIERRKRPYSDWERDTAYRVERVGYNQEIVTRNQGESVIIQKQGELWFKIFRGGRVVFLKSDNIQELYDPWTPPKPREKPKK